MYKVLLVDAAGQSKDTTIDLLAWRELGFSLDDHASTRTEAMLMFANLPYALVLINMNISQEEGIRLCEQIRETSRVPIILLGGGNDFQLARKAMCYQVSDYLPDPIAPDELQASLHRVERELEEFIGSEGKALTMSSINMLTAAAAPSSSNIIDKVKEFVEESLHQNITLKEISNIFHFNYSYLGQKFKSHENMTFNEYLLRQRMEKAKHLLEHTDMKIYEIANEVGYTEMDWFYKKFKSYTGVSANEFRKMISITA
ncbi:response regulator receiver domain-containing protein [Paenibacillus cellulosilyticus]|uniref:Response regulator receiver domain-containing protein n=1 Tax=Paenibacillus cellulosilyticus TaxID=375489 RepID=A0A2V2YY84_9BACL|nr:helix-turn-helix domain-containing protein [Paenibacillus cellulosilyticus]PWW07218.1 response regulator receiver domain-containing protein [Paenibacillus cellulosilyticus]QKS44585.1 helix-turn-helix domain-containing protein [Paenibacillus cellulosilyticus]